MGTLAMGMGVVNILENTVAEMDRPRGRGRDNKVYPTISNMHDCVGPRPYVSSIHAWSSRVPFRVQLTIWITRSDARRHSAVFRAGM